MAFEVIDVTDHQPKKIPLKDLPGIVSRVVTALEPPATLDIMVAPGPIGGASRDTGTCPVNDIHISDGNPAPERNIAFEKKSLRIDGIPETNNVGNWFLIWCQSGDWPQPKGIFWGKKWQTGIRARFGWHPYAMPDGTQFVSDL